MLDGAYAGVVIRPGSAQDRLIQRVFHRRQLAKVREVGLLVSALGGASGTALKEAFDRYKEALYPPIGGEQVRQRAELHRAMEHFDEIAEHLKKSGKVYRRIPMRMPPP